MAKGRAPMEGDVLTDAQEAFKGLSAVDQQEYIKQLQGIAGEKREAEIAELKARLAALGVMMEAPKPRGRMDGGRASPRVTHRNPSTGEEWRGRGRLAKWLQDKKDAGEDIEQYRVSE